MAYREPESSIYLLKGCPCDLEYNNTIYFENKTKQWAYFRTLSILSLSKQYYQRYERGYLRIQARADDLYGVNYMVFSNDPRFASLNPNLEDIRVFYCFVDNVEYINENVTEIHYTIDVMQTCMFDYKLGQCFVEREHTITDNLYENLIEEDIQGNNYVNHTIREELIPSHGYNRPLYSMMITYIPNKEYISLFQTLSTGADPNLEASYLLHPIIQWQNENITAPTFTAYFSGTAKNHTYTRAYYIFVDLPPFENTNAIVTMRAEFGETINALVQKSCVILNMTLVPRQFSNNPNGEYFMVSDWGSESFTYTINIPQPTSLYNNNGASYTVHNKKLLSYPYNYLKINNLNGVEQEYYWEHFRKVENNHSFTIAGVCVSAPECICTPGYYQGMSNPYTEYSITITDFPTSVWSEDTMNAYLAQNKYKIGYNAIKNTIRDFVSLYSGFTAGHGKMIGSTTTISSPQKSTTTKTLKSGAQKTTTSGGTIQITKQPQYAERSGIDYANTGINYDSNFSMAFSICDISNKPDNVRGQDDYSALRNIHNLYGFKFIQVNLREDEINRIDKYFDMFGYAIKNVKVPNIIAYTENELRPHWNYIKNGFTVVIPNEVDGVKRFVSSDDEEVIKSVYNKGITFWMDGEEVGDYSLDNSPQI